MSRIAEKTATYSIDPDSFVKMFVPNYRSLYVFKHSKGEDLMKKALFHWYESIKSNGQQEPRRALAEKLAELGREVSPEKQIKLEKLAKVFYIVYII